MNPIHLISLSEGQPQVWSRGTEQYAVHLICDVSDYLRCWPGAEISVAFERPDGQKYAHAFLQQGDQVIIPLLAADTAVPGLCKTAVRLHLQDAQANTCVYCGYVTQGVDSLDEAPGDVQQGIIEQTQSIMAASLAAAARDALTAQTAADDAQSAAAQSALDAARVSAIAAGNEAYTKSESNRLFSPAICETAAGWLLALADNAPLAPQSLSLYGQTDTAFAAGLQVDIALCGKNLLPPVMTDQSQYGMSLTANADGSVTLNGTAKYTTVWKWTFSPALPAGQYTLSIHNDRLCTGSTIFMVNTVSGTPYTVYPSVSRSTRTFTCTEPINGVQFTLMPDSSADQVTVYPQLEAGAAATAYAPYTGKSIPVVLESGLPALPVSEGGVYTDENGQAFLADEIDLTAGEYVQHTARAVLDGSVSPTAVSNGAFYLPLPVTACDTAYEEAQTPYLCCDTLAPLPRKQVAEGAQGIALSTGNVLLNVEGADTAELLCAYLAAHPVTVVYRPRDSMAVRSALPGETLAACTALCLPDTARIFNSAGLWQQLHYVADTKTYIDNRLAALSAALLQL